MNQSNTEFGGTWCLGKGEQFCRPPMGLVYLELPQNMEPPKSQWFIIMVLIQGLPHVEKTYIYLQDQVIC